MVRPPTQGLNRRPMTGETWQRASREQQAVIVLHSLRPDHDIADAEFRDEAAGGAGADDEFALEPSSVKDLGLRIAPNLTMELGSSSPGLTNRRKCDPAHTSSEPERHIGLVSPPAAAGECARRRRHAESEPSEQERAAGRDRPAGARRPPSAPADRATDRTACCSHIIVAQARPLFFRLRGIHQRHPRLPNPRAAEESAALPLASNPPRHDPGVRLVLNERVVVGSRRPKYRAPRRGNVWTGYQRHMDVAARPGAEESHRRLLLRGVTLDPAIAKLRRGWARDQRSGGISVD
jgi:hypothetical protein